MPHPPNSLACSHRPFLLVFSRGRPLSSSCSVSRPSLATPKTMCTPVADSVVFLANHSRALESLWLQGVLRVRVPLPHVLCRRAHHGHHHRAVYLYVIPPLPSRSARSPAHSSPLSLPNCQTSCFAPRNTDGTGAPSPPAEDPRSGSSSTASSTGPRAFRSTAWHPSCFTSDTCQSLLSLVQRLWPSLPSGSLTVSVGRIRLLLAMANFLMTGAIGFVASYFAIRRLYGQSRLVSLFTAPKFQLTFLVRRESTAAIRVD